MISCYEVGKDGFCRHRRLHQMLDIENGVVDAGPRGLPCFILITGSPTGTAVIPDGVVPSKDVFLSSF